ncbi:MAG: helix-turn-helix transcriptional regulator [Lachnospiraceae bacterium]|nr:helix-turn-helix transcriptional regulator [Lachnospiraceae bacterium]
MEFDIRYRSYTFKHSYSEKPDTSQERFKEHFHTSYELLYFVKGDADLMMQHTRYKIKPGSMLVIKPGEYHNIIFHSEAPYERYVIRVSPVNLHRNMPILLERTKSVYYIAGTPLEEEFLRMDRHLSTLHPDAHVNACIGSMDLILSYLISSEELTQDAAVVDVESKRILDYIDAHLAEVHSLEDLARGLSMSKSTLYRVFSRQLDTPLMTYVRTQQCILARNFLMEGIPAIEVASRLGFSHYSSFYRSYREVFHEAPTVKHR